MPIQQRQTDREEILEIFVNRSHVQTLVDAPLDRNYFTDDSAQQRYVRPGLIVARETNSLKYVPYNASALYGVGSDTAVGILGEFRDATQEDPVIDPAYHAKVIEAHCYVWGSVLGTAIPSAVKTSLNMVEWV